ncbi:MAG: hypothetical protein J1E80_01645 [Desulfovibrionaceae bacterium]|nr:hypothetical protein [Desulfovibrionaceae bacterium]
MREEKIFWHGLFMLGTMPDYVNMEDTQNLFAFFGSFRIKKQSFLWAGMTEAPGISRIDSRRRSG